MTHELLVMALRIVGALLIGGLIGLERSFHGRPAGFRTHSLVCVASSLLMLVTVYQNEWMTQVALDAIRTDPTRMAQGIMTGIGFLGAGVIFKEGLTHRRFNLGDGRNRCSRRHRLLGACHFWHDRDAGGPQPFPRD
jgi:putative Mg2+ transporter-C (MgtC) family protein